MTYPLEPSLAVDDVDPKWIRVAERIVADIERGALRIGSRLPAERELCVQLDVSRVTLRRAFASLEAQGVLRPSRGRGWFVSGRANQDWPGRVESFIGTAHRLGMVSTAELIETRIDPAGPGDADAFDIPQGTPITTLVRFRALDGDPVAVETIRIPTVNLPEELGTEPDDQRFMVLLAEHGLDITRAAGSVGARVAGEFYATWLQVDPASAIAELRIDVMGDGVLLLESRLVYGDRFPLRVWFE